VKALVDAGTPLAGDVIVIGVADEEVASIGIQDVLTRLRADAAIVTEPTELQLCLAHKGFVWIEVVIDGLAAHGSRPDLGIDANMRMGRFLSRLEPLEQELRRRPQHPFVGAPSLHAAVLSGGTGTSTYAASSRLEIERRTVPGESDEQVLREVREIFDSLAAEDPTFRGHVRPFLSRSSFEVNAGGTIAGTVDRHATRVLGAPPARIGVSYWMDAAFLGAAGIDTVVIGPTGAGAHADEEWVELSSVWRLSEILASTAREFCS
jgi:acetylornithine deacetylase